MRFAVILLVLLLSACGSANKKVYPPLEPIANKLEIKPIWVKKLGKKSYIESRQFEISLDQSRVYLADAKGKITALNQENGEVVWSRELGELVSGGPKVDGDRLYVSSNEAQLYALDANTGDVVWKSDLSSEMLADPVSNDKYLYLQTIDGKLYALNKNNGEKVWVDSREVPALTLRGTSSPLVLKSIVVAGFANGKIAAFDPNTGNQLWETAVAVASGRTDLQRMIDIDGSIQADADQIYAVTYQGRLAAISQLNGRTTWSREMSAFNGIRLDGNHIFLADASDHVWAIDTKTGATIWRQDKLEGRDLSAVAVLSDSIVVADGAGYVHWLSREDGSLLSREYLLEVYDWGYHDFGDDDRREFDFGVSNELKVANNKLYVRTNMGSLSVFQLPVANHN